jgi:hypothetical protein
MAVMMSFTGIGGAINAVIYEPTTSTRARSVALVTMHDK